MEIFKILLLRGWTIVVGVPLLYLLLPVETANPYKWTQQTLFNWNIDYGRTARWVNEYALVRPFQLWPNVTARYFLELENMTTYDCPRVYYPACAKNGVTYVNPCIMHALQQTFKRFGPCLIFRRTENETAIVVPKQWRTSEVELEELKKNFRFTKKDFIKMLNDSLIPFDLIKETHPELFIKPPNLVEINNTK